MPRLFNAYQLRENRVTASILAVFERLNLTLVERILQTAIGETELSLVRFENQIHTTKARTVPDGQISAAFSYWIETKVVRGSVSDDQLNGHLDEMCRSDQPHRLGDCRLLVLTPDDLEPAIVRQVRQDRKLTERQLQWLRFDDLFDAIQSVISDGLDVGENVTSGRMRPTEREVFLLEELLDFLLGEKLVRQGVERDVLVIPARFAIEQYERYHAYICQPNRPFQHCQYLAFYTANRIDERVPRVLAVLDEVSWTDEGIVRAVKTLRGDAQVSNDQVTASLRKILEAIRADEPTRAAGSNKVFLLSPPDQAVRLGKPVTNNLLSRAGRRVAFVQNQRYVSLAALRASSTTTDLIDRMNDVRGRAEAA